jgi:TPR repeat protein
MNSKSLTFILSLTFLLVFIGLSADKLLADLSAMDSEIKASGKVDTPNKLTEVESQKKSDYPDSELVKTPCADGKGKGTFFSEEERVEAYQFGLSIQQAVEREDVKAIFQLVSGGLTNGPRKKDISGKSFGEIFTADWKRKVLSATPSCNPVGYRGFTLGSGQVWYDGEEGAWSIYSIVGATTDFSKPDDPGWMHGNDLLRPNCFTVEWVSSDNYQFYHEHYGGDSAYSDFVGNIGRYIGVNIPLDPVIADWKSEVSLAVELTKCNIPHSSLDKPIKQDNSNSTITTEITDKAVIENCSSGTYECDLESDWYTVLRKLPLETCGLLAPQFKNDCIDIRLVQRPPQCRGCNSDANIYGIIKNRTSKSKRTYMVPLANLGSYNNALNYVDRLLADLSVADSKVSKPSVQEYNINFGTLIRNISKKSLSDNGETHQCGGHFFKLKTSGEDFSPSHSEYLEVIDNKGGSFNTKAGYRVSEVACTDLTGDDKPDLFLQIWGRGNGRNSYSSYVYLLEDPIKLVLEQNYLTLKFFDLNRDGIQEISSWYPFRYFGGLCGVCSPEVERNFCYKNGRYSDCSSQFPDYLKWKIAEGKEQLKTELEDFSGSSKNPKLTRIPELAVEILAHAILLGNENQESDYLYKILPSGVFDWLDKNRDGIRGILEMADSKKGSELEVHNFSKFFPDDQKPLVKQYKTGSLSEEKKIPEREPKKIGVVTNLTTMAKQGDVESQSVLGFMFVTGSGVQKNYKEAKHWLEKAVDKGNSEAQYNLGIIFAKGIGQPRDYRESLKLYRLAAKQGNPYAQYNLGWMYEVGLGVSQDKEEAVKWYRLAADKDDVALSNISASSISLNTKRKPRSYLEPISHIHIVARNGSSEAKHKVGKMYALGKGVKQNYEAAFRWFWLAAMEGEGNSDSQYNLGVMYENGRGVDKNDKEALRWFRLSAKDGNEHAVERLIALGLWNSDDSAEQKYPKVIQGKNGGYKVSFGSFETEILAKQIRAELLKKGLTPNIEQNGSQWELFVGPYPSEESALQAKSSIAQVTDGESIH